MVEGKHLNTAQDFSQEGCKKVILTGILFWILKGCKWYNNLNVGLK
jgi:hypothetical protein